MVVRRRASRLSVYYLQTKASRSQQFRNAQRPCLKTGRLDYLSLINQLLHFVDMSPPFSAIFTPPRNSDERIELQRIILRKQISDEDASIDLSRMDTSGVVSLILIDPITQQ